MMQTKFALAAAAALLGAGVLCPVCDAGVAQGQNPVAARLQSDTGTVKLHISGMTCGSCPITARLALKKLPGVLSASVTLDDSLGVVRYDPKRVTPEQIAAHLTKVTGYGATVIGAARQAPRRAKG